MHKSDIPSLAIFREGYPKRTWRAGQRSPRYQRMLPVE